jgi:hypothetical protein
MNTTRPAEYEVSVSGHIYWAARGAGGRFITRAMWLAGRTIDRLAEIRDAYRAYLEARREQADAATRGHLLRDWSRGSVARLFTPGASLRHASEELADWFEGAGATLTFRQFATQY